MRSASAGTPPSIAKRSGTEFEGSFIRRTRYQASSYRALRGNQWGKWLSTRHAPRHSTRSEANRYAAIAQVAIGYLAISYLAVGQVAVIP